MSLDIEKLKKTLECDNEFVVSLINNFLKESEEIMTEMNQAVESENIDQIRRNAHKLISSTRILGLEDLTVTLRNIQNECDANNNKHSIIDLCNDANSIWKKDSEMLSSEVDKLN